MKTVQQYKDRDSTSLEVLRKARHLEVKVIDFKFTDLLGKWHHKSVPVRELTTDVFEEGVGFDGSSIRGFQNIHESDMLLMPDTKGTFMDPFTQQPTLSILCDVAEPGRTKDRYAKDPRHTAQKAEAYLKRTGIADTSYWGPEIEFFIFDNISYHNNNMEAGYRIGIGESHETGGTSSLGHKIRPKEGYFPVPPSDTHMDVRTDMILEMEKIGIEVETHHHEVAPCQAEIDMRYGKLTEMADKSMKYKYIVKNVAARHGKTATFMPKPMFGDNGSGMHTHVSLWKNDATLFYDEQGYAELSELGLYATGGILRHINSLLAFCAPTTNSYKRLVPGYEAPVNIAYAQRNRSSAIRIPVYAFGPQNAKSKRIEFRCPDPSSNPYFAFSAILMAAIDGVKKKINPVSEGFGPWDTNIYSLPTAERHKIKNVPGSLDAALDELENDQQYLLEGGVFSKELLQVWTEVKRQEAESARIRPSPYEFHLYYDV
ncbi:type I glutamate--ammonia ligase [Candidatus Micrarchaeota archaeon]|nr:type I glutamate--ammonia ligase [Candidatus Micrarchaeota archaeon]